MPYSKKALKALLLAIAAVCLALLSPAAAEALDFGPLKKNLESLISEKKADIGIAVIYDGADVLTLNNDAKYPLMSVFKLHQAIAILKKLERDNTSLSETIQILKKDLRPDTYSPLRAKYPEGGIQLSIRDLLTYSLKLSDNNACDILFERLVDPAGTDKAIRSFGIEDFSISQTEGDMHADLDNCYRNWSTPLATARLIEKTLAGKTLSPAHTEFLKEMLTACQTGADRLPKPLPSDVRIGHKTGTGDRNSKQEIIGLNDAGFMIAPDGKRYVIVALIKDSRLSYEETSEIIARISEMVYSYIKSATANQGKAG